MLKTTNYSAARGVLGLFEILAWAGVAIGVMLTIWGLTEEWAMALPGGMLVIANFIFVVLIQMGKATVDTADYNFQMLDVARQQLAVSRQALAQPNSPNSFGDLQIEDTDSQDSGSLEGGYGSNMDRDPATHQLTATSESGSSQTPALGDNWDYRNTRINYTEQGFLVEGRHFETLELAREHVDKEAMEKAIRAGLRSGHE